MTKNFNSLKLINILDFGKMENSLQKNLEKLHESMGSKFIIKFNQDLIITCLVKHKTFTNEREFYRMYYEGEIINETIKKYKKSSTNIHPFIIDFIDPISAKLNEYSYINNIHKTENISGSRMMELMIKINQILNVKKTYLHDKACIIINDKVLSLSLFKLIDKGKTFYSKFGFDFDLNNINNYYVNKFDNIEQLKKKIDSLIKSIREIKTKDLIKFVEDTFDVIDLVIRNNDYENLLIKKASFSSIKDMLTDIHDSTNIKEQLTPLFNKLHNLLMILKDIKQEYFYKYLIETFNDKDNNHICKNILEYLSLDGIYEINYGNKKIVNNFDLLFQHLNSIKKDHYYSLEFS